MASDIIQAAVVTVLSQLRNEITEGVMEAGESLRNGNHDDAIHGLTVLAEDAIRASRELQEAISLQRGFDEGRYAACETCGTVYNVKYGHGCTCDD